jgi:hypothetical protein
MINLMLIIASLTLSKFRAKWKYLVKPVKFRISAQIDDLVDKGYTA